MLRSLTVVALAALSVHALNPIHDASVEFIPAFSEPSSEPTLLLGQFYTDESSQKIRAPGAYLYPFNEDIQLGFALQTRWYEEPNNVRHLVFGAAYRPGPSQPWAFQVDAMWGVANYAGDGLTFTGSYLAEPLETLHILGSARVGLFDALVWHPDYVVISASATPQLILGRKVRLDLEIFSATQFPSMADFYSLDLGPALVFRVNRGLSLRVGAHFGLLGPEKTSPRFELAQQFSL